MRRAEQKDKRLVVDILSKSFDKNKSVNYVVKQDANRQDRIRSLMEYSFNTCLSFGEIWISDDNMACALLLFPETKKTTLRSILWDVNLATSAIGLTRVIDVLKRESLIKKNHPDKPFTYLWFIGVDPLAQKRGVGSKLLNEVIDMNAKKRRPIYLETSVSNNLSWYKKFGFEIYQKINLNYDLYLLRRSEAAVPVSV
ncbi:MAG TPA: GNAT family N-acetyltransferase [Ohtaekwangia sp.]|nr:GNAT family N-acetyltransferase [Ohtaekwangia sp.]